MNVSNLLLIRGEARRKELAIRAALGSTRWGLLRQLMSEGMILSFLGAAMGLLLARWSQGVLVALTPASLGVEGSKLGWPIFVSTLLAASVAALLSGLFPALWLSRGELHRAITENGRSNSAGPSRHRLLHGLVVGQIAISLALLFVAALAVVSFRALSQVNPGFASAKAISFRVGTFANSASAERLIERLSLLPGVESVGASNIELLNDVFSNGIRITADNAHAPGGSISGTVDVWHATTNYFSAAGIPVRAGRVFETRDGYDVVIVNEALARRFFPNQNALGQSLRIPWTNSPGTPKRIVGIVGSVKQRGLRREDVPIYYMHYQGDQAGNLSLTVRTAVQPSVLVPALRAVIRQADPELTLDRVFTAEEMVGRSTSGHRFATRLMMAFATLAILLAVLGLYGVMSYIVQQRTKEIGVRLALGAQRAEVFTLIIRRGMQLVGAGLVVGGVIAFLAGRVIQGALFEVSPADPRAFAAVVALLVTTAFAACCFPARRATQVDPMTALKTE